MKNMKFKKKYEKYEILKIIMSLIIKIFHHSICACRTTVFHYKSDRIDCIISDWK